LGGDPDDDLPDIVDVVMEMGRAMDEPTVEAEAQALRHGSGRSSFEKPNRWLFVAFSQHSSLPRCPSALAIEKSGRRAAASSLI
jgi:hypothetical protein